MFEEIIKSISTIAFLVCTLFLGSIAPSEQSPANEPSDGITDYDAVRCAVTDTTTENNFSLVGVWDGFGVRYEFTSSGKLIVGNTVRKYEYSDGILMVDGKDGKLEILNDRVIHLDGRTLYRMK
ncbi:MAG: hypothetical protein ACLR5G_00235 [Eubacteriales bacterium]